MQIKKVNEFNEVINIDNAMMNTSVQFAIWMDKKRKSEIKFRLAYPTNELFKEFWKEYNKNNTIK